MKLNKHTGISWLTLFVSSGTLICCALPILLVSLGMGAAVVALTNHFPLLIMLTQHKGWIFLFSALLLAFSGWLIWRSSRSCPIDPVLAAKCEYIMVWNRRIFWVALSIWGIGFVTAYLFGPIRVWLDI